MTHSMREELGLLDCLIESTETNSLNHEGVSPHQTTRQSLDSTEIYQIPAIRSWITHNAKISDYAFSDAVEQIRQDLEHHNLFDVLVNQDTVSDPDNLCSFDTICLALCDAIESDMDQNQANLVSTITTQASELALTQILGNENLRDELQILLDSGQDSIYSIEPLLAQGLILAMAFIFEDMYHQLEAQPFLN